MKVIKITKDGDEITRYGFISHMEDYLRQLLNDPLHASVSDYLVSHGIENQGILPLLLKNPDKSDENNAILIRTERIKTDPETGKDRFCVKYKMPRKNFDKKMRNLYISLFENYQTDDNLLNEDANDIANTAEAIGIAKELISDPNFTFDMLSSAYSNWGAQSLINIVNQFISGLKEGDIQKALDNARNQRKIQNRHKFEVLKQMFNDNPKLMLKVLVMLLKMLGSAALFADDATGVGILDDGIAAKLAQMSAKDMAELGIAFMKAENKVRQSEMINEEGEAGSMADMGGATNASQSGQFVQPLFAPLRRSVYKPKTKTKKTENTKKKNYKTIILNEYQLKVLTEEAVMDTRAGDFGYDAPAFSDEETRDHKNICTDNNLMKDIRKGKI